MLKGLASLLAAMHLSSIAEWLTTLTTLGKKEGEKKNKEEEDRLVSLPPSLCRNFLPLISSFFNNQGLFSPLPTQWELMCPSSNSNPPLCLLPVLSLPLRFSAFALINITSVEMLLCFLWFQSLKKRSISNHSWLSLMASKARLWCIYMLFSWSSSIICIKNTGQ